MDKRKKQPKAQHRRGRGKSEAGTKHEEQATIETDHLLEEVAEANEHIADPKEREHVIPSRPC